jgi:hypothetical protein
MDSSGERSLSSGEATPSRKIKKKGLEEWISRKSPVLNGQAKSPTVNRNGAFGQGNNEPGKGDWTWVVTRSKGFCFDSTNCQGVGSGQWYQH